MPTQDPETFAASIVDSMAEHGELCPIEGADPVVVPGAVFDRYVEALKRAHLFLLTLPRLADEGFTTIYHYGHRRFWVRGEAKIARSRRHWNLERGLHLVTEE